MNGVSPVNPPTYQATCDVTKLTEKIDLIADNQLRMLIKLVRLVERVDELCVHIGFVPELGAGDAYEDKYGEDL